MNNEFLGTVKENRAGKLKGNEALTGNMYLSKEAQEQGLIDGIKTIDEILSTSTTKKPNKMTAAEYKAAHPAEHASIVAEGVKQGISQEQSRVKGWNAWRETDPEAVEKGIAGGEAVTMDVISEMSAKAANKSRKDAVTEDNAPDLNTPAPDAPKSEDQLSLEANAAELKALIRGGKQGE
jgi:ClpP class serine protease